MLILRGLVLFGYLPLQSFALSHAFESWFTGFGDYFPDKIKGVCRPEYEIYLHDPTCAACDLEYPSAGNADRASINLFNCMLENSDEYVKSNLAVGSVILGLLPTVLSFSGSTTTEVGLLALKRPVLATVLAISSPSILPVRALESEKDPIAPLRPDRNPFESIWVPSGRSFLMLSVIEYAFALASAANLSTQIWTLCTRSFSAMGNTMFFPLTWILISWQYIYSAFYAQHCEYTSCVSKRL